MRKNFSKKMLVLIVALIMVFALVPFGALGADAYEADLAGYPVADEYETVQEYVPEYPDYAVEENASYGAIVQVEPMLAAPWPEMPTAFSTHQHEVDDLQELRDLMYGLSGTVQNGDTILLTSEILVPASETLNLGFGGANVTFTIAGDSRHFAVRGEMTLANGVTLQGHRPANPDVDYWPMGGGVLVQAGGVFYMTGGLINNNRAHTGGGVVVTNSTSRFYMSGGEISDNVALGTNPVNFAGNNGGGVTIGAGATFTMNGNALITRNKANYVGGGVIVSLGANTATFNLGGNATISYNTSRENSGGVRVNGGTLNMSGGYIINNTSGNDSQVENFHSGGMAINHTAVANITGGHISGNVSASGQGDGISINAGAYGNVHIDWSNVTISDSIGRTFSYPDHPKYPGHPNNGIMVTWPDGASVVFARCPKCAYENPDLRAGAPFFTRDSVTGAITVSHPYVDSSVTVPATGGQPYIFIDFETGTYRVYGAFGDDDSRFITFPIGSDVTIPSATIPGFVDVDLPAPHGSVTVIEGTIITIVDGVLIITPPNVEPGAPWVPNTARTVVRGILINIWGHTNLSNNDGLLHANDIQGIAIPPVLFEIVDTPGWEAWFMAHRVWQPAVQLSPLSAGLAIPATAPSTLAWNHQDRITDLEMFFDYLPEIIARAVYQLENAGPGGLFYLMSLEPGIEMVVMRFAMGNHWGQIAAAAGAEFSSILMYVLAGNMQPPDDPTDPWVCIGCCGGYFIPNPNYPNGPPFIGPMQPPTNPTDPWVCTGCCGGYFIPNPNYPDGPPWIGPMIPPTDPSYPWQCGGCCGDYFIPNPNYPDGPPWIGPMEPTTPGGPWKCTGCCGEYFMPGPPWTQVVSPQEPGAPWVPNTARTVVRNILINIWGTQNLSGAPGLLNANTIPGVEIPPVLFELVDTPGWEEWFVTHRMWVPANQLAAPVAFAAFAAASATAPHNLAWNDPNRLTDIGQFVDYLPAMIVRAMYHMEAGLDGLFYLMALEPGVEQVIMRFAMGQNWAQIAGDLSGPFAAVVQYVLESPDSLNVVVRPPAISAEGVLTLRLLLEAEPVAAFAPAMADVSGGGYAYTLTLLRQYLTGVIDSFPVSWQ